MVISKMGLILRSYTYQMLPTKGHWEFHSPHWGSRKVWKFIEEGKEYLFDPSAYLSLDPEMCLQQFKYVSVITSLCHWRTIDMWWCTIKWALEQCIGMDLCLRAKETWVVVFSNPVQFWYSCQETRLCIFQENPFPSWNQAYPVACSDNLFSRKLMFDPFYCIFLQRNQAVKFRMGYWGKYQYQTEKCIYLTSKFRSMQWFRQGMGWTSKVQHAMCLCFIIRLLQRYVTVVCWP